MEDGKIHLKAQEFNRWMEAMGEEITRAKDRLALLSEEERRLSEIWESGAGKEWDWSCKGYCGRRQIAWLKWRLSQERQRSGQRR